MFDQETTGAREILHCSLSIFCQWIFFISEQMQKEFPSGRRFPARCQKQEEIYGGSNQNAWRIY
jgi:hypothetical protein